MSRRGLLAAAIFVVIGGLTFLWLSSDDPDLSMDGEGVKISKGEDP